MKMNHFIQQLNKRVFYGHHSTTHASMLILAQITTKKRCRNNFVRPCDLLVKPKGYIK